jgi:hypothetical protein
MNLGKLLAPVLTLASTVAGAIGVFDPSIPTSVRSAIGLAAAIVIGVYVLGHHILEAAKVKAGGVVAAAKSAGFLATAESDASRALHALEGLLPGFGAATAPPAAPVSKLTPQAGPPPAGTPGSNAGIAGTPTPPGGTP